MNLFAVCVLLLQSLGIYGKSNGLKTEYRLSFFDTDFLRFLAEGRRGNVAVSPASVKSVLGMLLLGAVGETADEITSALRLNSDNHLKDITKSVRALQPQTGTGTILQNANALFVSKNFRLQANYELNLREAYNADVKTLDFANPTSAARFINSWVSNNTQGLLKDTFDSFNIDPLTSMLVANALYFKSSWQNAFNPNETRVSCFYVKGVCRPTFMMETQSENKYAYIEALRAHAVELLYEGGKYSMILLLPINKLGVDDLLRDLPYMSLPVVTEMLQLTDVYLMMPKFTIDFSEDLVEVLKKMRISTLFSPSANLSRLFDGKSSQVDKIYHRVHLSADERGTVAAAVTTAEVVPLMGGRVQIRVDRPFLFFIRDNVNDVLLFEGKVEEPVEAQENLSLVKPIVKDNEPLDKSLNVPSKASWKTPVATTSNITNFNTTNKLTNKVEDQDIIIFRRFGIQ